MSDSRSDQLFHNHSKSTEQFDYFILAIVTAVIAYVVKEIPAGKFSSLSYDVYLASVVFLLLSAYRGFKRIEIAMLCKALNAQKLSAAESRGKKMSALQAGGHALNLETGDVWNPATLQLDIKRLTETIPQIEAQIDKWEKLVFQAYQSRNQFMMMGIIGVALAKVLAPYTG